VVFFQGLEKPGSAGLSCSEWRAVSGIDRRRKNPSGLAGGLVIGLVAALATVLHPLGLDLVQLFWVGVLDLPYGNIHFGGNGRQKISLIFHA